VTARALSTRLIVGVAKVVATAWLCVALAVWYLRI
jgi:hypothetical protein